ncbi:MAG: amidohydrolase family protein [Candidatus Thorarchaeota archaeon]
MMKLLVKNGVIFDPINKIEGEVKDVLIENGKFVDKFSSEKEVKQIDAKGKTIIPSALDIHAHIASYQLNLIRLLGAKNEKFKNYWDGLKLKSIANNYIEQGFSFILEANVYPSYAKQTLFDFSHIPVLDKAFLLNISNLWALELEYQKGLYKEGANFLSDLLKKLKGFGIKVYNPFEAENWNWNILRKDIEEKGRLYNFNALDVYLNITKIIEFLALPHSVHAHVEGYELNEAKSNLIKTLDGIKALNLSQINDNDNKTKRTQIFHLAHASSYNYDGDNSEIIDFYNKNEKFDLDLGFVSFNPINPVLTSDRRLINFLISSNENLSIIRGSLESEGDCFVALRTLEKSNMTHCNIWGNALDLALNIKNKWQIQYSLNYPIYGDIKNTPQIYALLMSSKLREQYMNDMNPNFLKTHPIVNDLKEYTFNDLIIITRSSPAKSLGLSNYKGNLNSGSDGDLNILNIDINEIDSSRQVDSIIKAFKNIEYVIKTGNIVKKNDKISLDYQGKIYWSNRVGESEKLDNVMNKKKDFYQKYSSIFYDSFDTTIKKEFLREI